MSVSELKRDVLETALDSFRKRHRVILTVNLLSLKKYTLATLMEKESFTLSDMCASDVERDIRKALKYLHDNGIVHGSISTSSVIIDGVRGCCYH